MSRADVFVTAAELSEMIAGGRPVSVLDVRWRLDAPDGRQAYAQGHVPGALYVSLDDELSDHTVSDETIGTMKNGRYLAVQAIDVRGQPITWMVPVADFGKAYDGPPVDRARFKSIYESPAKTWKDDTLQPHLRPKH